jgi:hypothetical protein
VYRQLELEVRGKDSAAKAAFAARKAAHAALRQDYTNARQDHQRSLLLASGGAAEKVAYKDAQKEKLEASARR